MWESKLIWVPCLSLCTHTYLTYLNESKLHLLVCVCVCHVRLSGFSLTTDASTNNPNPQNPKCGNVHYVLHTTTFISSCVSPCLCISLSLPLFLIYDESLPWAVGWKLRIWPTRSLWLTHIHLKMSHLLPVQTFYSPTVHSRRQLYSHWARVWARKPCSLWWLYMCTGRRLGSHS